MYDYNASYLNEQATLLEEFHKIQRYLIEHPLYQIYQSSADYVAGVNEYYINEVSVREGGTLSVGDVVLFSNVYYGVITEINEETEMFTIAQGISFRGETGPRGVVGPRGLPGQDGTNGTDGTDGKNGLSIYLYDGALNEDTTTINFVDQIELPTGREVEVGDLLLSTYASSFGAIAQVVEVDTSALPIILTVDYIGLLSVGDYNNLENKPIINADLHSGYHTPVANTYYRHIGTTLSPFARGVIYYYDGSTYTEITGGGGGGVSDVQINGVSIVADGVANIPEASETKAGVVSTGNQTFKGTKSFLSANMYDGGSLRFYATGITSPACYLVALNGLQLNSSSGSPIFNIGPIASSSRDNSHLQIFKTGIRKYYPYTSTSYNSPIISVVKSSGGSYAQRNLNVYLPFPDTTQLDATLMVAPSTWSTGTSGSVTLPSAGLYEVKATTDFGVMHTTLYWDGSNGTLASFGGVSGMPAIMVSSTGVITTVDPTDLSTPIGLTLEYRKIGIA